jgi:hypothetical protein
LTPTEVWTLVVIGAQNRLDNNKCCHLIIFAGRVSARGGWGISPTTPQMIQGGISPPQLEFFWKSLSVILRHLEAELIIPRCLKLFSLQKKINLSPQIHYWRKHWQGINLVGHGLLNSAGWRYGIH